ncbi:antibiotic biosynthesis monooxygenase [Advenella sp. S44]|nr:antibiotic biosynthesis monooxygenase [Advenella sp. S44]
MIFHLKTGVQAQFLGLLEPVLDAMRDEDTFVNAVLHQDPCADATYMLYETWLDREDVLNVQMHRPYRKAFWDTLPELLDQPRQIQVWKPVRTDLVI